jgi:RNA polymerase sigma-70 factor (sigma-E family)
MLAGHTVERRALRRIVDSAGVDEDFTIVDSASVDEGFTGYVAARRPSLVRAAVLLGCTLPDGEDLVQTALVRCYRHWEKVRRSAEPDAYVFRVLVNCLRDSRSRRWHREQPYADPPDRPMGDGADAVSEGAAVRAALRALPVDQRTVLVLRYYADLTEQQTASALGIPIGTVKSRAARGLASLLADPSLQDPWSTS